jgi:hypothetical protein
VTDDHERELQDDARAGGTLEKFCVEHVNSGDVPE